MKKFEEIINGPVPVLLDFYATWCGPCKAMHPELTRLKSEMGEGIQIVKLDIDKPANRPLVERFNVRSVPTLVLLCGGAVAWQGAGARPAGELRRIIEG